MPAVVIRSGGQTGVDRAALDFAVRRGRPYAGWCPRGGWAEDFPDPPGLLAAYPRLTETPSADPAERTAWNVRDSHATLILTRGDLSRSLGTTLTRQLTRQLKRPCLVVDPADPSAADAARDWLDRTAVGLGVSELVLNVAGPRESEAPGVSAETGRFLEQLLG
jgi:putative molybdenum carrier protein